MSNTQTPEWIKRLETVEFGFDTDGEALKVFIESLLTAYSKEVEESAESYEVVRIDCIEAHPEFAVYHPAGHEKKIYKISSQALSKVNKDWGI